MTDDDPQHLDKLHSSPSHTHTCISWKRVGEEAKGFPTEINTPTKSERRGQSICVKFYEPN